MGSSYSDLYLYFKRKKDDDKYPENGKNQEYTVTVSKSNYDKCVNFEKVTHSIEFTPPNKGTNYNVLLYDGDEKDKGKNVFGYYYPSNDKEVLSQLHVYYSVLDPDNPLVVSFVTRGNQTHNFLYSGLVSTRWVRAYTISYYSLGQDVSSELLTKEFKNLRKNRKIKFVTEKKVVQVSGYKQNLENDKVYRYIYYPSGNASVLGSESFCKFVSDTPKPLDCPKPAETPKPATQASSSSEPAASAQAKSTEYDNKIDPYYLDFVNGHHYDGVILYFVIDDKQQNTGGNGRVGSNGGASAGGKDDEKKDNYDHNMAVLLELIVNCKPKTHIQRKDKLGNYWSQEDFKYNTDKDLIDKLKEFQKSACENDSTTFILENRDKYKGVEVKSDGDKKTTYSKYTHTATNPNKPNLLFRKEVKQIGQYDPSKDKTISLDIYFLKLNGKEEDWPFIVMITNVDEKSPDAAAAASPPSQPQPQQPAQAASSSGNGSESSSTPQQQQQPTAQSGVAAGASGAGTSSSEPKTCKKCYFSSENYNFKEWLELKNDEKKPETSSTEKKEQPENDQAKQLQEKLDARLSKIEQFGQCTKDINILRSIAYQVLTGKDDPDTSKKAPSEPDDGRPLTKVFVEKGTGTSLPVVLGSVAAGLVVLGIISAIIYGIYWYNTTIKLLT